MKVNQAAPWFAKHSYSPSTLLSNLFSSFFASSVLIAYFIPFRIKTIQLEIIKIHAFAFLIIDWNYTYFVLIKEKPDIYLINTFITWRFWITVENGHLWYLFFGVRISFFGVHCCWFLGVDPIMMAGVLPLDHTRIDA